MISTKIRIVIALCAALCAVASVQIVLNHVFPDRVSITEAFAAADDVSVSECIIEATAQVSSMEPLLYTMNSALGYKTASYERKEEEDIIYIKSVYSDDATEVNEIITKNNVTENTYFHIAVTLKSDISGAEDIKGMIEEVLDSYNANYAAYIRINAISDGRMTDEQCRSYTDNIFARLNAGYVCDGADNEYYTQYGYTDKLADTITADNKLINVQASYSYNEIKDAMEISVGYPIINDSY